MAARKVWIVCCDHIPCGESLIEESATEARRVGRGLGWRHGVVRRKDSGPAPTVDFCSAHAADLDGIERCTEVRL